MPEDSLERAHDLARGGDLPGAAQVLERYLEAMPEDAPAHFQFAHLLLELGDPATAVQRFQRALELAPEMAFVHNDLGTTLELLGREAEAAQAYRRAAESRPPFPPAPDLCWELSGCSWPELELQEGRVLGSKASRSPSPRKLKLSTTRKSSRPGKTASQG